MNKTIRTALGFLRVEGRVGIEVLPPLFSPNISQVGFQGFEFGFGYLGGKGVGGMWEYGEEGIDLCIVCEEGGGKGN